ncbi:5-formyltetrahydrofolate cyclo-ligase [Hydrogenivirga caldilitoris]|uniref:5-formyltetrahydrofolate cyclo-ligase n=1 Tax=Hydrogenivirga caldilitoris TaxID=246264 RepID=A0A497XX52_9AQUI|nr:5-formyltetrahydrofolate cyclo-ligase [Hydrogenivirga caldilitoris]
MVETKRDIRRELLSKRVTLPSELKSSYDERIRAGLRTLPEFRHANRVLLYCPIKGEPDLTPLFDQLFSQGKKLVLPKVEEDELLLLEVNNLTCLSTGAFNILEPEDGISVTPEELDLVVVPGIAFDVNGYRIGFGKGYYDRLLERVSAPKVGVAYSFQVLDRVPRDTWDKPVDIVVTEKEVIRRC